MKRKATAESTALPSSLIVEKKARKVSAKENVEPVENTKTAVVASNKIDPVPDVADLSFEDSDAEALSLFNSLDFDLDEPADHHPTVTQHVLRKEAEHHDATAESNRNVDNDEDTSDDCADEESDSGASESSSNSSNSDEPSR